MLIVQLVVLAILVAGTHGGSGRLAKPCPTDFVSFYAAGRLADGSEPSLVYDQASHFRAEEAATAEGIDYVHFFYPPVYLLICGPLAHLPYLAAFVLFELVSTAFCLIVLRMIVGGALEEWWLPAASFSPLIWNLGIGQNACLTAGLFGLGTWLLHRRRPVLAGLVLSCLLFKPHAGMLVPVALAAAGCWRAFGAAAAGASGLALLSGLVFGRQAWLSFFGAIVDARHVFAAGQAVPFVGTGSVYGAVRMLGAGPAAALATECAVTVVVSCAIAWSWRKPDDGGSRYATLISGTLLVMPVVLFYDTVSLLVAGAWLLKAGRADGVWSGERSVLAAIWLCGLLCYPMTRLTHVPMAACMSTACFGLAVLRQARRPSRLPNGNEDGARSRPGSPLLSTSTLDCRVTAD